jgi:hypothetical protein
MHLETKVERKKLCPCADSSRVADNFTDRSELSALDGRWKKYLFHGYLDIEQNSHVVTCDMIGLNVIMIDQILLLQQGLIKFVILELF